MKKPYAGFMMYYAFCESKGCLEFRMGELDPSNPRISDYMKERYHDALKRAKEAIQEELVEKKEGYYPLIEYSSYKFVNGSKGAIKLVDYVTKNIPNSEHKVKAVYCMHGKIGFENNLLFSGFTEQNKSKLITLLTESKVEIKDFSDRNHTTEEVWNSALDFYQ